MSSSLLWCWLFLSNNIKIIFLALKLVKLLSSRSWRKCHCTCPVCINFPFTSCAGWFHTGDWIRSDLVWKIIHFYAAGKLLTKILSFVLHDMCYEADSEIFLQITPSEKFFSWKPQTVCRKYCRLKYYQDFLRLLQWSVISFFRADTLMN